MTKGYNLLKGTISHLQVMDDPKELRSDDVGLLAMIGLIIVGAFEAIGALIGALTASVMTSVASIFQILTSVIEHYIGNNITSKTAIVTYNAFGRLFLWGASLASIAGGMSAIFDFMDAGKANKRNNDILAIAYYGRAMATLFLSLSQFLVALRTLSPWLERIIARSIEKTIWVQVAEWALFLGRFAAIRGVTIALGMINFYATFIIIAVSVVIVIFDDNALQKWLDRCCFSKNAEHKKFDDLTEELTEFHQAIQETF